MHGFKNFKFPRCYLENQKIAISDDNAEQVSQTLKHISQPPFCGDRSYCCKDITIFLVKCKCRVCHTIYSLFIPILLAGWIPEIASGLQKLNKCPKKFSLSDLASSAWSNLVKGCLIYHNFVELHIHTHPFNGPFSGTTQVSRYQKGKINLDFTEATDSEWQWLQLGHMQVCT